MFLESCLKCFSHLFLFMPWTLCTHVGYVYTTSLAVSGWDALETMLPTWFNLHEPKMEIHCWSHPRHTSSRCSWNHHSWHAWERLYWVPRSFTDIFPDLARESEGGRIKHACWYSLGFCGATEILSKNTTRRTGT